MKRWLIGGIGVVAIVWAPYLYREISASGPEVEDDAEPTEFDTDMLPSLAELDAAIVRGGTLAVEEDKAAAPEESEPEDEALEPEEGDETPEEAEAAAALTLQARAEKAYEDEPRDGLWASAAEQELQQLIAAIELPEPEAAEGEAEAEPEAAEGEAEPEPEAEAEEPEAPPQPPEVVVARCRSTLCRVEFTADVAYLPALQGALQERYGERLAVEAQLVGDRPGFKGFLLRKGYAWDDL